MNLATALQFNAADFSGDLTVSSSSASPAGTAGVRTAGNPIKLPTFGNYVYAATARKAGRVNARAIPAEERQALLAERQTLLDKVFDGSATRPERNRLEYVRWSLDRIEDARHGEDLDRLEEVVVRYEQFRRDLEVLQEQLGVGAK